MRIRIAVQASSIRTRLSVVFLLSLTGCASIPPRERDPHDPHEAFNRSMYGFNDKLDAAVLRPVSNAYTKHLPEPVRTGVSNFYSNITYLDTTLNDFLQGKGGQGAADLGRFLINSTIGIVGIFDVATPMGLERHKEDFGQTLAVWGWSARKDEYLMYPVWGPSSVRDTGGIVVSLLTNPIFYATAPVSVPLGMLQIVDVRARHEGFVRFLDEAALDPYVFLRESYLQHREFEIYDGKPPRRELFDEPSEQTPLPPGSVQ